MLNCAENAVWLGQSKRDNFVGPLLRVRHAVNTQLRRITRWAQVGNIAIIKENAHAIQRVHGSDLSKTVLRCKKRR